ncbi:MAG: lipopolysaccharide heptosyltransferase I [Deltaproteobacteria bacterium]|nr:lipopolysaccharide heptosyltransferase I [Deltaproteobacteria bacterium]
MKVLIVKTSALGDILHALPVLDYLHRVSPGIKIDWVVEECNRELLDGNPLLNKILLFRSRIWRNKLYLPDTWKEIIYFYRQLHEEAYDYVFDIQGNLKSGMISSKTKCNEIFGFTREELQESVNLLFTKYHISMHPDDHHITDKILKIVKAPFGGNFDGISLKSSIATSHDDNKNAEVLLSTLRKGPIVLFHCGTTWQTKLWTNTNWIELGRRILSRYADANILYSWGDRIELNTVTTIARATGPGTRILEGYSLKGLCALLKKIDLVVGGDTGPVHLAASVGTPTVSLYRSSDGMRSGPRGNRHVIIQTPLDCACCYKTSCARDEECRNSITPEMLLKGCVYLLERY